jgi:hypothetical protein
VLTSLSIGKHVIGLKVKDEDDVWSEEVFATLEVLYVNKEPTLSIDKKEVGDDSTIRIEGKADDDDGRVVVVEVKVGPGEWRPAMTLEDDWSTWYYDIETKDLTNGVHRVYARAFDGEDHSEEDYVDIEVKEEEPLESMTDLVYDAITGKNLPCFVILLISGVALLAVIAMSMARRPSPPPPPRPRARKGARKRRKKKVLKD